jgi:hypothetical protein
MNNWKSQVPIIALCSSLPSVLVCLCATTTHRYSYGSGASCAPTSKIRALIAVIPDCQALKRQFGVVLYGATNSLNHHAIQIHGKTDECL